MELPDIVEPQIATQEPLVTPCQGQEEPPVPMQVTDWPPQNDPPTHYHNTLPDSQNQQS